MRGNHTKINSEERHELHSLHQEACRKLMKHIVNFFGSALIIMAICLWTAVYYPALPRSIVSSLICVVLCFSITPYLLPRPGPLALTRTYYQAIPVVLSIYCCCLVCIALLRIEYSQPALLMGIVFSVFWFVSISYLSSKKVKAQLFYLTNVDKEDFDQFIDKLTLIPLKSSHQLKEVQHGLVVNFHRPITLREETILADASLNNISIYHADLLKELLERKVSTRHLSQDTIEAFNPNNYYLQSRLVLEKIMITLSLPILLPLSLVLAILIKFESPKQTVIFKQTRIGLRSKPFTIYKFRTMNNKIDGKAAFATHEHSRINWLGQQLRKTRLDEIPQLFNVLKGEMSVIGPRPEQPHFVEQYQEEIPFYHYRHIVRPGITGWAQVEQGYTNSVQSTKDKLAYDLYYIKHLSFDLDIDIVLKTIKTLVMRKGV